MKNEEMMTFRVVINKRDFVLLDAHKEHPVGKSLTVPDESYTIRELVAKHVSGMRIADELERGGSFDSGASFDSEDLEMIGRGDIFDREQFANELKLRADVIRSKLREASEASKAESERKRAESERKRTESERSEQGQGTDVDAAKPPRSTTSGSVADARQRSQGRRAADTDPDQGNN